MSRPGELRVYLGASPGVGKTVRMLEEGRRRAARGTDVVVGLVESHGRPHTEALVEGLEVVPRRTLTHRAGTFTELDVDAVLRRRPAVALVDELAHTNIPGSKHAKRWQDVHELLDAGITVITTLNVQHLESLNDVVRQITGTTQRETVPDAVVRAADQLELVDMAPDALRRRMAHGNVYPAERIDAALGNYFRVGNLTALRELALLWVADKVDQQLDSYRAQHHIDATWEARERVVVALTGGAEGDTLVRRAARVAARTKGADLLAVHVTRSDGLADADPVHLARQRVLVESVGGSYHQVLGADIPSALLDFARGVNATQLVLGASRRGRLAQLLSPGVGVTTTALSGPIDVHLVTHDAVAGRLLRRSSRAGLSRQRRTIGFAGTLIGFPLLTFLLDRAGSGLSLPSDILAFLVAVVAVALIGGLLPALLAAVLGFFLLNYFFTPPLHLLTVADRENLFALLAFLLVGVAVSTVVDLAARRTSEAARARAEAQTLSTVAGSVLRGGRPLHTLLDQVRETFGQNGVTLLERRPGAPADAEVTRDAQAWTVVAEVGDQTCFVPADGDAMVLLDELRGDASGGSGLALALRGHPLSAADRRLVEAFAAQAAVALRQERLAAKAAEVDPLTEVDRLRTALLNAVSHDLRTPLAAATTAVGSLLSADLHLDDDDRRELLEGAALSLGRLTALVDNLLDLSRLQAGALAMARQPISVLEVLPNVLDDLGAAGAAVVCRLPDDVDDIDVDPALLERVVANLLANAVRHTRAQDDPPLLTVSEHAGHVDVRVIDHGPGVPPQDWDRIFLPFQRLGDQDTSTGVGLGLALARGLTEAMGGTLVPETTPGGGLTMTLTFPTALPIATASASATVEPGPQPSPPLS